MLLLLESNFLFFLPPDSWNSYLGRYCKVNDLFNDVYDNFAGFIATV